MRSSGLICAIFLLLAGMAVSQTKQASVTDGQPRGTAPNTNSLRQQLVANEQQLAQAEKTKNANSLQRELTSDFLFVAYNGKVFTKEKVVKDIHYINVDQYQMENFKVRQLGPDAALLTYDLRIKANVAGDPAPAKEYASSVWVKQHGQWRLVFHQESPQKS
jgi:hypothetical protein